MNTLFPFPHFIDAHRHSGSIINWPDKCLDCIPQDCRKSTSTKIGVCSRGFNYLRLDAKAVAAGVVLSDVPVISSAQKSVRKRLHDQFIKKDQLLSSQKAWSAMENEKKLTATAEEDKAIESYLDESIWKTKFIKQFEADIKKGLSFVHDYKQVNMQLAQNINVIIERRYNATTFEEKLKQATKEERAIYEAAKYLEEKLRVAKFLMNPDRLEDASLCCGFRFHGLVHKYYMIYSPRFVAKNVTVNHAGNSFSTVYANPEAVGVIPHTLIDNASKYASKFTAIEIVTQDIGDAIQFEVSSYGPQISEDEKEAIFRPFYRGKYAEQVEEEGAGYGLYIAQLICKKHLGCEISVRQDATKVKDKGFWTSFRVDIPLRAIVR